MQPEPIFDSAELIFFCCGQALEAHYATVYPHVNEMIALPDPALVPCCQGQWPNASQCRCQRYTEHHVYP
jgi:hypothetical protein